MLLMVTARWAIATALAICTVALLHDAVWLGVWRLVYPDAPAEPVVFHFGPMVACAIAYVSVLAIQIWRHTAEFRRSLGRRSAIWPRSALRLIRARRPLVNRAFTRSLLW